MADEKRKRVLRNKQLRTEKLTLAVPSCVVWLRHSTASTLSPLHSVMRVLAIVALVALALLACASVASAKFDASSSTLDASMFDTGAAGPLRFSEEEIMRFLERGSSGMNIGDLEPIDRSLPRGEKFAAMRRAFIKRVELEAKSLLVGGGNPADYVESMPGEEGSAESFPYWQFIPVFEGGVTVQTPLDWSPPTSGPQAGCFSKNTATLAPNATTGAYTLSIDSAGAATGNCSDFYLFATIDGFSFQTISSAGSISLPWSIAPNSPPSHLWDLTNKGVRVFRFRGSVWDMLETVVNTALLFEAQLTQGVSTAAALRNIDFLSKYANVQTMLPRNLTGGVQPFVPESEIQSGDFFGVMRLDGLDPMLAWAMGSTTGHATTALWMGGQLYVCESTVKAPHWPVNGIQKTPYRTWLAQVNAAGQGAVHAPLSAEARASFNETAAVEFFLAHEGMDYGYHTLLWGWLDTIADNYPCVAPDFQTCLNWETFEVVRSAQIFRCGQLPARATRRALALVTHLSYSIRFVFSVCLLAIGVRSDRSVPPGHWQSAIQRGFQPSAGHHGLDGCRSVRGDGCTRVSTGGTADDRGAGCMDLQHDAVMNDDSAIAPARSPLEFRFLVLPFRASRSLSLSFSLCAVALCLCA